MPEILKFVKNGAAHITPRVVENLLHKLPLFKVEFTQIKAPQYPHLVNQLEFLADAVEDFADGTYKDLPYAAMAGAVFALIYTHREADIIPNFIPEFGFADNSAIVRCVLLDHEVAFSKYAEATQHNWRKVTSEP